jgi:ABC-2 type transport system permease protein
MKKLKLKKPKMSQKQKWTSKSMKNGSYAVAATALLVAILIIVNLIVGELPSKYTKLDVSSNQLYSIGEQTETIVKGLEEDVTLYLMAESDSVDTTVQEMLERYSDLSSHVKVEVKDPVLYPNFASQYTEDDLTDNSIIVVSDKRSKVVDYNDIYETGIDYSTYSYQTTGFDGEGLVTSAIAYVTSDDLPIMYVVQGHEEVSLTDTMENAIEKENIEIQELNLLTADEVPEDAGCIMILSPQKDFSEEEAEKVIDYLEAGGKAFIVSDYTGTDMPNFYSILQNYGVQPKEGVVLEGDANYYASGNPSYLVPSIESSDALSGLADKNTFVLMPVAQAVEELENRRDTIEIENLLMTSDSAYIKADVENMTTLSKESGDEEGSFPVGVAITEAYDSTETKILYLTGSNMFNDNVNEAVSGGNMEVLTNGLSWMCDHETSVSIASKSLQVEYLTMTSAGAGFWSTFATAFLPILSLVTGGIIWFRRRKQ